MPNRQRQKYPQKWPSPNGQARRNTQRPRGHGVPERITCANCMITKPNEHFSDNQFKRLFPHLEEHGFEAAVTVPCINCTACSSSRQRNEIKCEWCDTWKAISDFHKNSRKRDEPSCKICWAERFMEARSEEYIAQDAWDPNEVTDVWSNETDKVGRDSSGKASSIIAWNDDTFGESFVMDVNDFPALAKSTSNEREHESRYFDRTVYAVSTPTTTPTSSPLQGVWVINKDGWDTFTTRPDPDANTYSTATENVLAEPISGTNTDTTATENIPARIEPEHTRYQDDHTPDRFSHLENAWETVMVDARRDNDMFNKRRQRISRGKKAWAKIPSRKIWHSHPYLEQKEQERLIAEGRDKADVNTTGG